MKENFFWNSYLPSKVALSLLLLEQTVEYPYATGSQLVIFIIVMLENCGIDTILFWHLFHNSFSAFGLIAN